jgi:hypothetical protein
MSMGKKSCSMASRAEESNETPFLERTNGFMEVPVPLI